MNKDDFRYMLRGKQLNALTNKDLALLKPVTKQQEAKHKALLVLHGFSSTPAVYRFLIPQIKHYDAIICPALPGHAESINAFSMATAADWFQATSDVCASLIKTYEKVDVLGLSLGGILACELSKKFTLNHLYLLAPALKIRMNAAFLLQLAKVLKLCGFVQMRNAAGDLMTDEHAEIAYRKLPLTTIIEMLQLAQHYQWIAPSCPVDLFLGRNDHVVNVEAVEQLFSPLPNTTIHWLEHSAHVLPLDKDLKSIIQCINKG